jgi:trehalose/maltose hydrolase-like predicted phosphorylase
MYAVYPKIKPSKNATRISGEAIRIDPDEAMKDLEDVIRTNYLLKKELKITESKTDKAKYLRKMLKKTEEKLKKYADYLFGGKNPLRFFDGKELAKNCFLEFDEAGLIVMQTEDNDFYKQIDDGISDYIIDRLGGEE